MIDKLIFNIKNIKLCSVNNRYVKSGILSKAYRDCKEHLTFEFKIQNKKNISIDGVYSLWITIEQYADIDNYLKVINDALEESGVISNDKNCLGLQVSKIPSKKGDLSNILIIIEGFDCKI